jgi:L-rhamnose isomerase
MMRQEELKFYPVGDVWEEFCARNGVIGNETWFDAVKNYENEVLLKRV